MARWEYETLMIQYDAKRRKDWVLHLADGATLVGLPQVLQAYGRQGWELVSLSAEQSDILSGFAKWVMQPTAYRATFKRPVDPA